MSQTAHRPAITGTTKPSPATIAAKPAPPAASTTQSQSQPRTVKSHRRGEIWMVASDPQRPSVGTEIWSDRPALVISGNVLNGRSGFAQIVYLSTSAKKRSGPTHVPVPSPDRPGDTMALCEQVHTVDRSRLIRRMGHVPADKMTDIDAALTISLSIGRDADSHGMFRKWERQLDRHGIDIAQEIQALAGETTDQRVEALTRAVEALTIQRDALQHLIDTQRALPSIMHDVASALESTDSVESADDTV